MLSDTCNGIPYEYTCMGCPICVWDIICILGRTHVTMFVYAYDHVFLSLIIIYHFKWLHSAAIGGGIGGTLGALAPINL